MGWLTIGDTPQSRSSLRITPTVRAKIRWAQWMSFATWSRRFTAQESRSFSTSSSIIQPKGTKDGPTVCLRGIDNSAYYFLEQDRSRYSNYSGTGNTLNANHPIVRRMIVDSLRYWVEEMHVDGFRFDLASIFARDSDGNVMSNPPVLWDIESDPVLDGTKMIAEAWDAAGLYQVGNFIGDSWKEWNGCFRDDVRSLFRGDNGALPRFADRFIGSHELFGHEQREAEQSVNFVDCHDGFTLNDLVSYNHKHNEANQEGNRDGGDDNRSWNCGVEGPTTDPEIERLRYRQAKNFMTVVLLSLGLPMFQMGDEVLRTQHGNNNAYCQDNEENWLDWSLLGKHAAMHRFVKLILARRILRDPSPERQRMPLIQLIREGVKGWHGVKLNQPDWGESFPQRRPQRRVEKSRPGCPRHLQCLLGAA